MSKLTKINNAINKGRGKAAAVYGQRYNVFRLSSASNVSVNAGTPVHADMNGSFSRYTARNDIEQTMFELLIFSLVADGRQLELGDVLVEDTAYGGDGANYIVGSMRPLHQILAVRAEANVKLSRISSSAGDADNQPVSGSIAPDTYAGSTAEDELVCVLQNGTYSFVSQSTNPTPATIPCGLQPQSRKGLDHQPSMPTQVADAYFVAFMPLLPGIDVEETDVITVTTTPTSTDRYQVAQVFTTQDVGFAGWVLHLVKMDY